MKKCEGFLFFEESN